MALSATVLIGAAVTGIVETNIGLLARDDSPPIAKSVAVIAKRGVGMSHHLEA